jgi:hypothetical protein
MPVAVYPCTSIRRLVFGRKRIWAGFPPSRTGTGGWHAAVPRRCPAGGYRRRRCAWGCPGHTEPERRRWPKPCARSYPVMYPPMSHTSCWRKQATTSAFPPRRRTTGPSSGSPSACCVHPAPAWCSIAPPLTSWPTSLRTVLTLRMRPTQRPCGPPWPGWTCWSSRRSRPRPNATCHGPRCLSCARRSMTHCSTWSAATPLQAWTEVPVTELNGPLHERVAAVLAAVPRHARRQGGSPSRP